MLSMGLYQSVLYTYNFQYDHPASERRGSPRRSNRSQKKPSNMDSPPSPPRGPQQYTNKDRRSPFTLPSDRPFACLSDRCDRSSSLGTPSARSAERATAI